MQLLARWAPAAQALALVHLASAIPQDHNGPLPDLTALLTGIGVGAAEDVATNVDRVADRLEDLRRAVDQLGEGIERELGNVTQSIPS